MTVVMKGGIPIGITFLVIIFLLIDEFRRLAIFTEPVREVTSNLLIGTRTVSWRIFCYMQQIQLSGRHGRGLYAIVDDEDINLLIQVSWALNNIGYAIHHTTRKGKSKSYLMHRVIMKAVKGQQVDHINGNKLDNRKSNLRFSTQTENRFNARKGFKKYSQYKGVRFSPNYPKKPWMARFKRTLDKEVYIGQFENERHAALAYDLWIVDMVGEFAKTNFPVVAINQLSNFRRLFVLSNRR
jgi:hypothetical protein